MLPHTILIFLRAPSNCICLNFYFVFFSPTIYQVHHDRCVFAHFSRLSTDPPMHVCVDTISVAEEVYKVCPHVPLHSLTVDVCAFCSLALPLAIVLFLIRFARCIRGENE